MRAHAAFLVLLCLSSAWLVCQCPKARGGTGVEFELEPPLQYLTGELTLPLGDWELEWEMHPHCSGIKVTTIREDERRGFLVEISVPCGGTEVLLEMREEWRSPRGMRR